MNFAPCPAATLKYGMSCVSTWKAYAPPILMAAWPVSDSARNRTDMVIAVRKIGIPMGESGGRWGKGSGCHGLVVTQCVEA